MDTKKILEAVQTLKGYCENRNCNQCLLREILDCVPAGGEASVPCNWNVEEGFDPEDVSKMFMNCEKLEPVPGMDEQGTEVV